MTVSLKKPRPQKHIEMEQTCLKCSLPECKPHAKECPFVQAYGSKTRTYIMHQHTCGVPEQHDRLDIVALDAAANRALKRMGFAVVADD